MLLPNIDIFFLYSFLLQLNPKSLFEDINFYIGLIIALVGLIASTATFGAWLIKSVNKTNSAAISTVTVSVENSLKQISDKIEHTDKKIDEVKVDQGRHLTQIESRVSERQNFITEKIIEVKGKVEKLDEKMNESRQTDTKHATILQEHDRRITDVEKHKS